MLRFEDYVGARLETTRRVASFLDLDPDGMQPTEETHNHRDSRLAPGWAMSLRNRSHWIRGLARHPLLAAPVRAVKRVLYRAPAAHLLPPPPPPSREELQRV